MILNYAKIDDRRRGDRRHKYLIENEKKVNYTMLSDTRTSRQNRAMHKFFNMIADILNEQGLEWHYIALTGEIIDVMHTGLIVKEYIWKPIMKALFDIESTKDIDTRQINMISDTIIKHFGETGYSLVFPSIKWLIDNE